MIQTDRIITYLQTLEIGGIRSKVPAIIQAKLPEFAYVRWQEEEGEDPDVKAFRTGFTRIYLDEETAYAAERKTLTGMWDLIQRDETDAPFPKRARIIKIRLTADQMRKEREDGVVPPEGYDKRPRTPGRFTKVRPDQVVSYRELAYYRQGGQVRFNGLGDVRQVGPE